MHFPLRPYQGAMLDAFDAAVDRGVQRPLGVLPTGGGKTVVFVHGIARRGGRALILAHRDELLAQAADKVRQIAPDLTVGTVKAEQDDHDARVVVGSVQTLAQPHRLERLTKDFTTVVVDEAHHAIARSYLRVLAGLGSFDPGGPATYGVTATAGRTDEVALGHVWEEIVYTRGILQMIADGYLVDIRALAVSSDVDLSAVKTRGGDFADDALADELEDSGAIAAGAAAYATYAADRRGIAFTPTVKTSKMLTAELRDRGIPAEHVDGTTPRDERRGILARLHDGTTQVVTNAMVLTEGFDEPSVSCILNLRPTKSEVLFTQMVGRALRPFPGKENALLLDVAGASDLGLATIATLAGLDPAEVKPDESLAEAAERLTKKRHVDGKATVRSLTATDVSLFARSRFRWMPYDGAYLLPVGKDLTLYLIPADADRWDVYEHPKGKPPTRSYTGLSLDYAYGVGEELARADGGSISKNTASWRKRQPTDAQVKLLTRFGYGAVAAALDQGQASDLISAHIAGRTVRRLMHTYREAS